MKYCQNTKGDILYGPPVSHVFLHLLLDNVCFSTLSLFAYSMLIDPGTQYVSCMFYLC